MSSAANSFLLPPVVSRKLDRLRRLVRLYVALDGLAAVALLLGGAFWAGLAADWLWEPGASLRALGAVAVGLAAVVLTGRLLGQRLAAELPDASLALLLERRFPSLNDSLATAVDAARQGAAVAAHPQLLAETGKLAAQRVVGLPLSPVFNWTPLLRKGAAALAVVGSIAAFAVLGQQAFAFYLKRLRLSDELWPRRVALAVVGFVPRDGQLTANVAQGDACEVLVNASLKDGHEAPDEVEVRWRTPADGARGGESLVRLGEAVVGRDDAQQYRCEFKPATDVVFDLIGGDARLRNLRIRVVPRPVVQSVVAECEFPAYMQRAPRTLPVSQRVEVPVGSRVACRLDVSKPAASATAVSSASQQAIPTRIDPTDARRCWIELGAVREDQQIAFTMTDEEGVTTREPFRLAVVAVPDEVPEISVRLRGIGTAVTPQARLPLEGRVSDDYGLTSAWFAYQIDAEPPQRLTLGQPVAGKFEVRDLESFDLQGRDESAPQPRFSLQPGQKLSLTLEASDACDLRNPVANGASQQFSLEIVTPSELRALLERRELALRQRFEAIHEKMAGAAELLDRVAAEGSAAAVADPQSDEEPSADEARRLRDASRLAGTGQTAAQLAFETLGVAEAFREIVLELQNNRIDTQELTQRLVQGVAEPLEAIGENMLPDLETRLDGLREELRRGAPETAAGLVAARAAARATVEAMREVLDRMLELESYNELVELLREIVREQERLNEETKSRQKDRLRDLLEE